MEAEETNMKSWQLEKNINPASPTKFRHHLRVGILSLLVIVFLFLFLILLLLLLVIGVVVIIS